MARIVLGLGTSHSPILVLRGEQWEIRSADDMADKVPIHTLEGRRLKYAEYAREFGEPYKATAVRETFVRQSNQAQAALDRIADSIAEVNPDVIVIVGDDQDELYGKENNPAFSVYYGADYAMRPHTSMPGRLTWAGKDFWAGYSMDEAHRFPGSPEFAAEIIDRLVEQDVDVAACQSVPKPDERGFGHAVGFVVKRLFRGRQIPVVPVLINTYYPPNTPTPKRCYDLGVKLGQAIRACRQDLRVAVIASGGLSHFICEEGLDTKIIEALRTHDGKTLCELPPPALQFGSSEIRNWICVAGAVNGMQWQWDEYVPVRRTPIGTGIGLAFIEWR